MIKRFLIIFTAILIMACSSKDDTDESSGGSSTTFDLLSIEVTNKDGNPPRKGDVINIKMTVKNTGNVKGNVALAPKLTSSRFSDYSSVSLQEVTESIEAGETSVITLQTGPFFKDTTKNKHYALGRGEYYFDVVKLNGKDDKDYKGRIFEVAASNRVLVPVIFDYTYLSKVGYTGNMKSYLENTFTRKVELYDNDTETYTEFPGGLDEMMDIEQLFYTLPTDNVSSYPLDQGLCEKAIALGGETLGLTKDWAGDVGTQTSNHGFDYLMAITPDSFGGVACGWINVQITGVFDFDLSLDRSQILIVHETSHLLGSPHCDPLQTYVMCSGEKHRKYINAGIYVFNTLSRNKMSNKFD